MSALFFTLFKSAIPYLVAGIAGFGLAFGIQELRLTHVEQAFAQYKIDQQKLVQQQIDQAAIQRKRAYDDFLQTQEALQKDIAAGEVFKRCVATGKCGVRHTMPSCPEPSVSTSERVDGPGSDAVPAPAGDAAINECAQTTMMLNKLQADVEAQSGYSK